MPEPAAQPLPLCPAADLADGGRALVWDVLLWGRPARAFVLRHGGQLRGYINRCAHVPVEMDWQPGHFLDMEHKAACRDSREAVVGFLKPERHVSRLRRAIGKAGAVIDQHTGFKGQRKGGVLPVGPCGPGAGLRHRHRLGIAVIGQFDLQIHRR